MDATALRAEIKAWERDFKTDNGRDPTIQDIKNRPDIAEKYKLYKKLNKAKTQPSTPPKRQPKQLFSKPRAIKTEPSIASTNPFSPVKNKGGGVLHVDQTRPIPNPFPPPREEVKKRELSPDPFPLIQSVASTSQATFPSQPTSAVSRARKRLRGEPVSPSPVKPKRPRFIPSGGPIPFLGSPPVDSDEDHDHPGDGYGSPRGSAFLEETPRKDRLGNKAFASLFNEDDRMTQPDFALTIIQPQSASRGDPGPGLFTGIRTHNPGLVLSDDDGGDGSTQALPRVKTQTRPQARRKPKPSDTRADRRGKAFDISSRLTSSRGNHLLDQDPSGPRSASVSATSGTKSNASTVSSTPEHGVSKLPPTSSAPTSDAEMDEDLDSANNTNGKGRIKTNLIPVSPPPPSLTSVGGRGGANAKRKGRGKSDSTSGPGKKWKGKGKASAHIPAWTLAGGGSEDGSPDDEDDFPIVRTYQGRNPTSKLGSERDASDDIHGREEEITEDLVSGIKRRIASQDPDPDLLYTLSQAQPHDGDMVVNLREEFRTILDLNANAAPLETIGGGIGTRGKEEYLRHARVVRAVREGTRVIGMFDPSRGGHIWGVGETEREADADLGTEDLEFRFGYGRGGVYDYDDWEEEGVPWEVAGLEHDDDETRL